MAGVYPHLRVLDMGFLAKVNTRVNIAVDGMGTLTLYYCDIWKCSCDRKLNICSLCLHPVLFPLLICCYLFSFISRVEIASMPIVGFILAVFFLCFKDGFV